MAARNGPPPSRMTGAGHKAISRGGRRRGLRAVGLACLTGAPAPAPSMPQVGGADEIARCGNEQRLASFRCNNGEMQRSTTMRIKLTYIGPLLAAGAAAVAIAAAPTAAAANVQTCSGNICQS